MRNEFGHLASSWWSMHPCGGSQPVVQALRVYTSDSLPALSLQRLRIEEMSSANFLLLLPIVTPPWTLPWELRAKMKSFFYRDLFSCSKKKKSFSFYHSSRKGPSIEVGTRKWWCCYEEWLWGWRGMCKTLGLWATKWMNAETEYTELLC